MVDPFKHGICRNPRLGIQGIDRYPEEGMDKMIGFNHIILVSSSKSVLGPK